MRDAEEESRDRKPTTHQCRVRKRNPGTGNQQHTNAECGRGIRGPETNNTPMQSAEEESGDRKPTTHQCRVQERNPGTGNQQYSMESPVMDGQFMAPLPNHRHPYSRHSPFLPSPAFLFRTPHRVESCHSPLLPSPAFLFRIPHRVESRHSPLLPSPAFLFRTLHRVEIPHPASIGQ